MWGFVNGLIYAIQVDKSFCFDEGVWRGNAMEFVSSSTGRFVRRRTRRASAVRSMRHDHLLISSGKCSGNRSHLPNVFRSFTCRRFIVGNPFQAETLCHNAFVLLSFQAAERDTQPMRSNPRGDARKRALLRPAGRSVPRRTDAKQGYFLPV